VAQIVTAVHRDVQYCMHRPTNEPLWCTKNYLWVKIAGRK